MLQHVIKENHTVGFNTIDRSPNLLDPWHYLNCSNLEILLPEILLKYSAYTSLDQYLFWEAFSIFFKNIIRRSFCRCRSREVTLRRFKKCSLIVWRCHPSLKMRRQFLFILWRTQVLLWSYWYPVLDFWCFCLWFQMQGWIFFLVFSQLCDAQIHHWCNSY